MGAALERLLMRPSSLELLRCLVDTPASFSATLRTRRYRRTNTTRAYASSATAVAQDDRKHELQGGAGNVPQEPTRRLNIFHVKRKLASASTEELEKKGPLSLNYYGSWKNPPMWKTADDLEYESNITTPENPLRPRLLNQPAHCKDFALLARLLDYQQRNRGMAGIRMYWDFVKERGLYLPTRDVRESRDEGSTAEKLWASFLSLGFHDEKMLQELCDYADKLLRIKQRRWSRLYAVIVQHFLLGGRGERAIAWHNKLIEDHPPTVDAFSKLCHHVVRQRGDLKALEIIYDGSQHRNVYDQIVPTLTWQDDFKSALNWHFRLLRNGDLPSSPEDTQALSRFLAIYDKQNAARVAQSLVDVGINVDVDTPLRETPRISRETMNLIHGMTFKIPVKEYNDEYGARWFATTWVPLDLAMRSVHALGMQEIGPLSFQAMCIRPEFDGSEPSQRTVIERIEQLRRIGIHLGNSVFSRAVEHFARYHNHSDLKALLQSDRHPDFYEDWKQLEALMSSFALARDWGAYRRLMAIRTLTSKYPEMETQNIWLRNHFTNGDLTAALDVLEKMRLNNNVVKTTTVAWMLKTVLVRRRPGHRHVVIEGRNTDLTLIIRLFMGIMDAGNAIPAVYWREIVRRLGMENRQRELHELCLFLVDRYGPENDTHWELIGKRKAFAYRVPAQVDPSHSLHPLKILFDIGIQRAIVEWGFISGLARKHQNRISEEYVAPDNAYYQPTAGITLLRKLQERGVDINRKTMQQATLNRLIIYYGPGESNKPKNRVGRRQAPSLDFMRRQINEAMGEQIFNDDLKMRIVTLGRKRLMLKAKKDARQNLRRLSQRPMPKS